MALHVSYELTGVLGTDQPTVGLRVGCFVGRRVGSGFSAGGVEPPHWLQALGQASLM